MSKTKIAALIVAGAMAVGGGMAFAETAGPDPVLDPLATGTDLSAEPAPVLSGASTAGQPAGDSDGEADPAQTTEDGEAGDAAGDGDAGRAPGAHPENHGAAVSAAAHDRSHDDECGNHGAYVSSVARGEEQCTPRTSGGGGKIDTDTNDAAPKATTRGRASDKGASKPVANGRSAGRGGKK